MSRPRSLRNLASPPVITAASRLALGGSLHGVVANRTGAASGASPWSDAADTVLAFPFVLESDTSFYKVFWVNGSGTLGGTRDVAIYDDAFSFIVGTGAATAASGVSVPQVVALTATTKLPPGLYYAGMGCSVTTTGNQLRWVAGLASLWQAAGCWKFADANPINLNATPADMTNVAFPLFGLITRSGFDV